MNFISCVRISTVYEAMRLYLHNGCEYGAAHRLDYEFVDAVSIGWRVAVYRFRRQFVASHDQAELERA